VVQALEAERKRSGRDWRVVGYEAMTNAAAEARRVWESYANVQVVRELVLTEDDLEDYILPFVEGPVQNTWPGREFYNKFYEATSAQVEANTLGGWLKTKPCRPQMVLIDSTRFAHLGVMATLFHTAGVGVDNRTVFVVENDFWEDAGRKRNTLAVLQENMQLEVLVDRKVPGEMWPWFVVRGSFPVGSPKLQGGTAAERRKRRLERRGAASPAQAADVWAHSHSSGGRLPGGLSKARGGSGVTGTMAIQDKGGDGRGRVVARVGGGSGLPPRPSWEGKESQLAGLCVWRCVSFFKLRERVSKAAGIRAGIHSYICAHADGPMQHVHE